MLNRDKNLNKKKTLDPTNTHLDKYIEKHNKFHKVATF